MKDDFEIKVTIHDFDEDNTTKLKYKRDDVCLSDHVPLEIEITKL